MDKIRQKGLLVLRSIEKYTKTDMVYLAQGGFWTIFAQIIISLSTLGLAIAFAHYASKETYGQYKYILSIASILGTLTLTGLGPAVIRSVNRGFDGTMNYAFWQNIKWSVLFFLTTLSLSVYYFLHGNTSLGVSMLLVGAFSPFWSSTNLYNSFLAGKKDFRRSALYFGIMGNLFPVLCLFTAIILGSSPTLLITVYFISNTLIGVILYIKVLKIYKPNDSVDNEALAYSKHLSFMGILGAVADNIDQILIFHYIGAVELAIYNFAIAIPSQIKGPIKGFAGLIFPKFVERSDEEIKKGIKNKYIFLFLVSICIIISYVIFAPYIFHIFFPKYTDSIFYSRIFSISLLWIIAIPADAYWVAKKKIREQYITNISSSIIQIAVLFVGILWWGLLGLVLAQIMSKILRSLISMALFERSSKKIMTV